MSQPSIPIPTKTARDVLAAHPYILAPPPAQTRSVQHAPAPSPTPTPAPAPVQTTQAQEGDTVDNTVVPQTTTTVPNNSGYAPLDHPSSLVSGAEVPSVAPPAQTRSVQQRVGDTIRTVFHPLEAPIERVIRYVEQGPVATVERTVKSGIARVNEPLTRGLDHLSYHVHRVEEPINRLVQRADPYLTRVIRPAENLVRQGEVLAHRVVDPIERQFRAATGEITYHLFGPPPPPGVDVHHQGHPGPVPVQVRQRSGDEAVPHRTREAEGSSAGGDPGKSMPPPPPAHTSNAPASVTATPVPPVVNADGSVVPDNNMCSICMAREKNALFIPCRHVACCMEDAHASKVCPLCRGEVTGVLGPIFI